MCDRHYYNPGWQSQNHSAVRPCRSGMNSRPSQPRKHFPTAWRRTALTTELPVEHMKFRQIKLRAALAENRKPLVSRSSRLRRSFAAAAAVENPALRHFLPGNRRPASADARQNSVQVQPDAAIDHDPLGPCPTSLGLYRALQVAGDRVQADDCCSHFAAAEIFGHELAHPSNRARRPDIHGDLSSSSQWRLDLVRLRTG